MGKHGLPSKYIKILYFDIYPLVPYFQKHLCSFMNWALFVSMCPIDVWEPPTVIQATRLLPSAAAIQRSKLLGQQMPRSERRQYTYTAARGEKIQALACQRPQLQLRLQLVRTQPSSNGIKIRTYSRLAASESKNLAVQ
jgi:hypothetical protein